MRAALVLTTIGIGAVVNLSMAQLPATDLYRVDFGGWSRDTLDVRSIINLTSRPGYDNQPYVRYGDVPRLYFSSVRGDGQSDIWCRDLVLDGPPNETRVTSTIESEYSPGQAPIADAISVVRVETDSSQRLVAVELSGEPPFRLLSEFDGFKKIGYYAWVDSFRVVLFVLADPNELWVVDTKAKEKWLVASNIGRCFRKMWWLDETAISFVQRESRASRLCVLNVNDRTIQTLTTMPEPTVEDYEWLTIASPSPPPGLPGAPDALGQLAWLICGRGSELLIGQPDPTGNGQPSWKRWADLTEFGVGGITRLIWAQAATDGAGHDYQPCWILVADDVKPSK